MDILLDTHIALWLMNEDPRVTNQVREIIQNKNNDIYYSVVSMWEVAIKKLELDDRHVCALETLESKEGLEEEYKDPFDRMLLSQAKTDCMTLLTHDKKFNYWNEPYYFVV